MAEQTEMSGRVLAGRYRLETRLGEGGMGSIWRAQHLVLAAPVAVKLIDPEIADDEDSVTRFIREAQSAASLRSPHVVQIIDYGVEEKHPFIVMELLEGENLAQRLKRTGPLSPGETARIVTHMARAMARAHDAGIVHRDLKPENVFIVHNMDEDVAKVLDFGVAKVDTTALGQGANRTRTGSLLGTPYYMSPEQAQGNKSIDARSDLWSLGVIAFECLTGARPFYSDGLGDLVLQICVRDLPVPSEYGSVPVGFDAWFAKACARDPEARFQSAREMADTLRDALGVESRETVANWADVAESLSGRKLGGATPKPGHANTPARAPAPKRAAYRVSTAPTVRAADPRASTLAVGPESPPSLTTRQFGTTQRATLRPGGTGLIWAVGLGALAVGLVAGFLLLGDRLFPRAETEPTPPKPRPAATRVDSERVNPSVPVASPAQDAGVEGADAAATATDGAAPVASGSAAAASATGAGVSAQGASKKADAEAAVTEKPDAAWVKPAWAQPEDEAPLEPLNEGTTNPY